MKKPRSTRMLNTLSALGRISARYESVRPSDCTSRYVGMRPALKNIVASRIIRIHRCPSEPIRERPYAHSTDTVIENTVPTRVTRMLMIVARVTWPPLSSSL